MLRQFPVACRLLRPIAVFSAVLAVPFAHAADQPYTTSFDTLVPPSSTAPGVIKTNDAPDFSLNPAAGLASPVSSLAAPPPSLTDISPTNPLDGRSPSLLTYSDVPYSGMPTFAPILPARLVTPHARVALAASIKYLPPRSSLLRPISSNPPLPSSQPSLLYFVGSPFGGSPADDPDADLCSNIAGQTPSVATDVPLAPENPLFVSNHTVTTAIFVIDFLLSTRTSLDFTIIVLLFFGLASLAIYQHLRKSLYAQPTD
jgi:hypothetical protein